MNELGLLKIISLRGFNIGNNVIRMKKKKRKKNEVIDDSAGHFASSIWTFNSTLNNI